MTNQILVYIGAGFVGFWGIAHLFPTKNVVADFGDISEDNRNIITMEWIVEGMALIFIGALVITSVAPAWGPSRRDHERAPLVNVADPSSARGSGSRRTATAAGASWCVLARSPPGLVEGSEMGHSTSVALERRRRLPRQEP